MENPSVSAHTISGCVTRGSVRTILYIPKNAAVKSVSFVKVQRSHRFFKIYVSLKAYLSPSFTISQSESCGVRFYQKTLEGTDQLQQKLTTSMRCHWSYTLKMALQTRCGCSLAICYTSSFSQTFFQPDHHDLRRACP